MIKYITVKLTEDQAYRLIRLIEWRIRIESVALKTMKQNNYGGQQKQTEKIAFNKRLLTKLAQSVVTEQAKS